MWAQPLLCGLCCVRATGCTLRNASVFPSSGSVSAIPLFTVVSTSGTKVSMDSGTVTPTLIEDVFDREGASLGFII